jgi:hypothetical protein
MLDRIKESSAYSARVEAVIRARVNHVVSNATGCSQRKKPLDL